MKPIYKKLLRILNFVVLVAVVYFVVSPVGSWMPRIPNWTDFWAMCVLTFLGAWIDFKITGKKPNEPKPPKGAKYA